MTATDRARLRELAESWLPAPGRLAINEEELADGCIALLDALDRAEAELGASRRGYQDLHSMVQGEGDIWTKVDRLKTDLTSRDATIAELRGMLAECREEIDWRACDALLTRIDAALKEKP